MLATCDVVEEKLAHHPYQSIEMIAQCGTFGSLANAHDAHLNNVSSVMPDFLEYAKDLSKNTMNAVEPTESRELVVQEHIMNSCQACNTHSVIESIQYNGILANLTGDGMIKIMPTGVGEFQTSSSGPQVGDSPNEQLRMSSGVGSINSGKHVNASNVMQDTGAGGYGEVGSSHVEDKCSRDTYFLQYMYA